MSITTIHSKISEEQYRALPAVNWSTLKAMRQSPLAYKHALDVPRADTPAFAVGRAVHCLTLEPREFESRYAVYPDRRQGKTWEAFAEHNAHKTILTEKEYEQAKATAVAVRSNPIAAPYLVGEFEQVLTWIDPATGLHCKARADLINRKRKALIDLKSCPNIEAHKFGRGAAKFGYHCQLAHYGNGMLHDANYGFAPEKTVIVAVEKDPPYDVAVFILSDDDLYAAQQEISELLGRVKACKEAKVWPGRYVSEQPLLLPSYVFESDDENDSETFGLQMGDQ